MDNEIIGALDRYVKERIPTGGFLMAVLENDLFKAFNKADTDNTRNMLIIVKYIYNNVPSGCYGSPEEVKKWLDGKPPVVKLGPGGDFTKDLLTKEDLTL